MKRNYVYMVLNGSKCEDIKRSYLLLKYLLFSYCNHSCCIRSETVIKQRIRNRKK